MATKREEAQPQAKSNSKLIIIIIGAVVILALVLGVVAFLLINKQHAASTETEGAEPVAHAAPAAHVASKVPPVYLSLDNMVVNLADPGGEKVAQIGITFEVIDAKASDSVKAFLPAIRSGVLLLLSQRTSEELLSSDGKQKLIQDILREASVPFGGGDDDSDAPASKKKKKRVFVQYPVINVLFSSLIIQ